MQREENEFLTRTGPGTPMGELFRRYGIPAMSADDLPGRDGAPVRVRLLGEDLVAFRDTSGKIAFIGEHCPHRGASLFLGRNEEYGLRCVYHGWKYDVAGNCVDMPNEPPETSFAEKIYHQAYPCWEQNGVIWAYMGPRPAPPPHPELEWTQVPEGHYVMGKTLRECNWAQAFEGDIDDAHVSFLHGRLRGWGSDGLASKLMHASKAPHLEVLETVGGVMYGVRRPVNEDEYNWRIKHFMFPSFSMITTGTPRDEGTLPSHMWTPIDDYHTMQFGIRWNPTELLTEQQLLDGGVSNVHNYLTNGSGPLEQFRPVANR